MPFGYEAVSKKKLTGWVGVAASTRTRKARATQSRPPRAGRTVHTNPPMNNKARGANILDLFPKR